MFLDPSLAYGGDKQRAQRRSAPSGQRRSVLISSDIERDCQTVTELVMCAHCGRHWPWRVGASDIRGWCSKCNGFTCGPLCPAGLECVPHEQFIENIENGRPLNHRPTMVATGGVILGNYESPFP